MLRVSAFLVCGLVAFLSMQSLSAHLGAAKTEEPRAVVKNDSKITDPMVLPKGVALKQMIPPGAYGLTWELETYQGPSGLETCEYAIEVTHVMFDWSTDRIHDSMNIKWNRTKDLEHRGDGAGVGEYVPEEGNDEGRNDPALWLAANSQTVRVRIRLKQVQTLVPYVLTIPNYRIKMKIRAVNLYTGCGYLNLAEREVEFYENANHEYVSLEAPIPPGGTVQPLDEYPIFQGSSLFHMDLVGASCWVN